MGQIWFDDALRLEAARTFQTVRISRLSKQWLHSKALKEHGFMVEADELNPILAASTLAIQSARDVTALLTEEGRLTKKLYAKACRATGYGEFTRSKRGEGLDAANQFLDHGNYLAYGLGATATWVLGIPHSLAVLHGKTRRGGLVFDVADLVKDAVILPQAFISAMCGHTEQEFRKACIESLTRTDALDFMIDTIKATAQAVSLMAAAKISGAE